MKPGGSMQYSQGLFDNPIKIWNGVRKKKKKKKGKASKFVDARNTSNNWNERGKLTPWNGSKEKNREEK